MRRAPGALVGLAVSLALVACGGDGGGDGGAATANARDDDAGDRIDVVATGPLDGRDLPPFDTGRVAVGDTAPDFTLRSRTGEAVTLSELYPERRIILAFYRGHW